ncbi:DUF983 domain-containing protein [Cochlodiniinecator piscidefendens]|uniref:DUF983 domain-containing protein n=1 Tax=Cochlodiniinecator piscidefendens TaxID=2715756 RepID=UPI00140DBF54|nr:DUF983 domain-containing protein [Cochlodiniinecator piscidefendens]
MSDVQSEVIGATDRSTKEAVLRGWKKKCPNCGSGPLLQGYLKVRDTCAVCDQDLHHHRADDGPAYVTILVVGHLMGFVMHFVYGQFRPEPMIMASVLLVGFIGLSLYMLPRVKGAIVGYQWAKRMHGFGKELKA